MTIKIEGHEFEAFEGETILDVARRNNIQIPTICYLSGCSPTLACKMCMVEVSGKRVYSCNAKIKDGMDVIIHNEALDNDRNEIMTTYCVNHPLECGVCDKSGECELQDFTLYTQVDVQQFGLQEADKKPFSFAQSFYDPALCIMCERCITTCKDNIGENNLKVGKVALFTPDNYKDSMNKDPYSVWSKRQKGLIEFAGKNECKDCGECIAVCPVGAMTYKDFTYTSNAWELEKIHSTCTHCAGGCEVIYNVKHLDVKGDLKKVYRVQNDFLYNPICGVGRFAFDTVSIGTKDLTSVLQAFSRADSINLGGNVSNEEALLVSLIGKKLNIPVINREGKLYQTFQKHFLKANMVYFTSLDSMQCESNNHKKTKYNPFAHYDDVKNASTLIALDSYFKYDAPSLRYKINNNLKMQKNTQLISIGVFKDSLLQGLGKNITQIIARPGYINMAGILGLIFANDLIDSFEDAFPSALQHFLQKETNSINEKDSQVEVSDAQSPADNLSPYNLSPIFEALNLSNLDSLKVTKKGGVLMISLQGIEEFICNDLKYIHGYGLSLHHNATNPPSITEAISTTIAENLTEPIANDLMDKEAHIEIFAHLLAFLCQKLELKLLYVPKETNILGIANICDLGNTIMSSRYSIGIRTQGDFILDSNLETIKPHFPLPTLAQLEGSITSLEGRVLPLFPSIPYLDSNLESAFDISDIARELGALYDDNLENTQYLGDFTKLLSDYTWSNCRKNDYSYMYFNFKNISYENLKVSYEKDGTDNRGYFLEMPIISEEIIAKDSAILKFHLKFSLKILNNHQDIVSDIESKNMLNNVFQAIKLETQNQFSKTTLASKNLQSRSGIYVSKSIFENLGLQEGEDIVLHTIQTVKEESDSNYPVVKAPVYCDYDIEDSILLVSPLLENVEFLFADGFYTHLVVVKANITKDLESQKIS
ncbi:NADH-quinone oxidoreductase subunit G [Helicobacter didelphidarum]|uniref:NADH-quinone oxidoreductase subunit G n=1 Tax=Helicobacter didelphidarum TaxID=2040648 RepID=A0A3D8IDI7_9HELI|nr:NADH-quinone oxidoreductase subunit G [Helicobacter didelphidarum]RDU62601.1 NADH-quinone oxidoreductase subunit G [Helicobacter didelphidarum]